MVYLVGAGPGDPGLLTVKGLELIKKADCIVYDRLASPELLAYARPDCECIYVGKADRRHTLPQQQINELLVQKNKGYRCVVRLKGGDSYVFGRGGEEGIFLREHGVSFSVVPGISSAIAGAAYAGIPVTHRGVATGFRVITAHNRKDETTDIDYSTMTDSRETLTFFDGTWQGGRNHKGASRSRQEGNDSGGSHLTCYDTGAAHLCGNACRYCRPGCACAADLTGHDRDRRCGRPA